MDEKISVNESNTAEGIPVVQPMTKKEILRRIKSEEKSIAWRERTIEKAKDEIRGSRKAIVFWNKELKKIEKKGE